MARRQPIYNFTPAEDLDIVLQRDDTTVLADKFRDKRGNPKYTPQRIASRRKELLRIQGDKHPKRNLVIPTSPKPKHNDPLILPGPSAVVLSDLHVPYQDADFIENVLTLGTAWGIDTCIINGDLFDAEDFAKWAPDPDSTFEQELSTAEAVLERVTTSFDTVAITRGNHEDRILGRALDRQVRMDRFVRMFTRAENVRVTGKTWLLMESPRGTWAIMHQRNASVIDVRAQQVIADRRFSGKHVIGGHCHRRGTVWNSAGTHQVFASGACCDIERLGYVQDEVTTRPMPESGAVIIKDGIGWLLWPEMPWDAMRGMYAGEPAEAADAAA